jgi:hypothetical protein
MTMRKTPFERIRYPWTDDVVNAADIQSMGSDIDQALAQTANLASQFSKFASVSIQRTAAQSITKSTLTAISFNASPVSNNGANSPLSNGSWFSASQPTRLTAPVACVVLAVGTLGMNFSTALGVSGALQVTIALNGATSQPGVQGTKWNPISTNVGQTWASAISMWSLNAGDFLELKTFWTGTPAGPFNTDTALVPVFSLAMVGLPTVP